MSFHPLIVAQYDLQGHHRRTEHWSLVVMFNLNDAHVFEIIGNTDTYEYVPRPIARFSSSNKLRGGCQIGMIRRDLIGWLEVRLRQVQIIRNNPQWDCQDWVMEAIRWMKWMG